MPNLTGVTSALRGHEEMTMGNGIGIWVIDFLGGMTGLLGGTGGGIPRPASDDAFFGVVG